MADMGIEIVDHDSRWAEMFDEQRDRVSQVLARWLVVPPEHIGSTAVSGLRAKPVVDILAPVGSLVERDVMVKVLSGDGWLYWPDDPKADSRLWFLRPCPEKRTHHLHVIEHGHPQARALLVFRDALRRDSALAARYELLKERLARDNPTERNAYTNGKALFVAEALRNAGIEAAVTKDLPE
ncbi:GrpB family protein [Streptomyces niveus]|uniref:GrpB family protein n=1 Tax=Streptomyces niveus TaxID=193462 RepID=UPI003662A44E